MLLTLPDLESTYNLGHMFGLLVAKQSRVLPVFFYGEMGVGKTTLISALVAALPNGETAQTSSPSFTLCNMYATTPPVAHFDMYRQENASVDESLLDFLDGERHLVLVEWAERLPEYAFPPERVVCEITTAQERRMVRFSAFGLEAESFLNTFERALGSRTNSSRDTL